MSRTHTVIESPVGQLTLVATDGTISGLYFPGHWTRPDPGSFGEPSSRGFKPAQQQLAEYFRGERTVFSLPMLLEGDCFQREVWDLINKVPYGQTTTYGEIARRLGDPKLARQVGSAVGQNPLSVIVPCHRVVGKDGALTGYAGGLARKRLLLELEDAIPVREQPAPSLF